MVLDKFETVIKMIFYITSAVVSITTMFTKDRVEKKLNTLIAGMILIIAKSI